MTGLVTPGQLWRRYSRIGSYADLDFQLLRRVQVSNQYALITVLLTLFFMFMFSQRPGMNPLYLTPVLFFLVLVPVLNHLRASTASRLFMSVMPAFLILSVNIMTKISLGSQTELIHYLSPRFALMTTVVLPVSLFSFMEKKYMFSGLAVVMALIFGYDAIHASFGLSVEQMGLVTPFYGMVVEDLILSITITLSAFFFVASINAQIQRRNLRMLQDSEERNRQMEANEARLTATLQEVEQRRQQEEDRNWVAKGAAEFAALLRQMNTESSYILILTDLIRYVEVNQGVLYLLKNNQEGEEWLEQVAAYAWNRVKYGTARIMPGEGLAGQCLLEKEPIVLKQVPDRYLRIRSGLGEAAPRFVAIYPLIANEKVEGVLELASFQELSSRQTEYLIRACNALAGFVAQKRMATQTEELLRQAQLFTEQLRHQELAMKAQLEDLQVALEESMHRERAQLLKIRELSKK